jgi:hypothetical protein
MPKSFVMLWEAMEARRRQMGAGEVPPAYRFEQIRRAWRQSVGCPDGEALGGWLEGGLWRVSLRRWLMVWQHICIRRCRECHGDLLALAVTTPARCLGWTRLWLVLTRLTIPLHRVKTPMVWGSSILVVMIGLSLWSFDMSSIPCLSEDRAEAPVVEESIPQWTDTGDYNLDARTEPIVWADYPHAQLSP